jgi:hypothetical protein
VSAFIEQKGQLGMENADGKKVLHRGNSLSLETIAQVSSGKPAI